ncbi:putative Homeodomain-like superfamily protein [Tripterygium wilfordii]|uniref:Putative Homeodomain-like superfamily protein n=1 Tax=Tripterygium wilfordii TaxID=458696 RepID=A0A7J7BZI3_TRIWF|nr:putative Homeodomain-like superfamily protein [Tripterygium wilfordii]
MLLDLPTEESRQPKSRLSVHPPPAFGSSPNLGALVLEANKSEEQDGDRLITYIWFLLVQRLMYQLLRLLLSAMDMESYTGGLLVSTSAQQPRWCHCPTISLFWMEKSDYNNSMEAYNIKQVIGVVYDVVLGFGSSFPSLYASSFKKRQSCMHLIMLYQGGSGGSSVMRDYRKGNWTLSETMVLIEAKMDDERRMKTSG